MAEGGALLEFGGLIHGGEGHVGSEGFLVFAGAQEGFGSFAGNEEIDVFGIEFKLVGMAGVKLGELARDVETRCAGGGEGGILGTVLANALATNVEVPRQADRGLATHDEVERVILVGGHGDTDFDRPVIIGNVSGHFGLRFPAEPRVFVDAAVNVHEGAGGVNGNLVVAVRIGL